MSDCRMVSWSLEVLLVVEQGNQRGITSLQCVKGSMPSHVLPIPSQATGSLGCWCSRKPPFVLLLISESALLMVGKVEGMILASGMLRYSGHCPCNSYRSRRRGGEQLHSPAALGQGEANCWAVVSPAAVGWLKAGDFGGEPQVNISSQQVWWEEVTLPLEVVLHSEGTLVVVTVVKTWYCFGFCACIRCSLTFSIKSTFLWLLWFFFFSSLLLCVCVWLLGS